MFLIGTLNISIVFVHPKGSSCIPVRVFHTPVTRQKERHLELTTEESDRNRAAFGHLHDHSPAF